MQKIDRLGWTAGLSFVSYGVRVGVRSNDARAIERAMTLLPHGWKPSPTPAVESLFSIFIGGADARGRVQRFSMLFGNLERLVRSFNEDEIFTTLESRIRLTVAERARRRIFVHAGVVGWKDRAILIPGNSFSGKTTMVAELVRAGATYYSDEYAVLDEKGRVHPFLKPLSIREDGAQDQTEFTVEELGGRAGTRPLPVGLVLISQYKKGARWRPQKLSTGQGALEMLAHTINARTKPGVALATLNRVASSASVLKSRRGEARSVIDSILKDLS